MATINSGNSATNQAASPLAETTAAEHQTIKKLSLAEQKRQLVEICQAEQINSYGLERWNNNFTRLTSVQEISSSLVEGEKLQARMWNDANRRLNREFVRFQRIFCEPADYLIPNFVTPKTVVGRGGSLSFKQLPKDWLAGIPVNPRRISDKLAVQIGIMQESDLKLPPLKRLEIKSTSEAIELLKDTWSNSSRLRENNHRILIVDKTIESDGKGLPLIENQQDRKGIILYVRENTASSGNLKSPLMIQPFPEVYSAHRRTLHANKTYQSEIRKLVPLAVDISSLRNRLNTFWVKDISEDQKAVFIKETQKLNKRCNDLLSACQDKYKVDCSNLMNQAVTFKDLLNRENITTTLLRMTEAVKKLEKRMDEVAAKGGYNSSDQIDLDKSIIRHQHIFKTLRDDIKNAANFLESANLRLFGNAPLTDKQINADISGLKAHIGINRDSLKQIRVRPFSSFSELAIKELSAFDAGLKSRDLNAAKEALLKTYLITKACALDVGCRHLEGYLGKNKNDLLKAEDLILKIENLISRRQIFENFEIPAYKEAFIYLDEFLDGVKQKISALVEVRNDPEKFNSQRKNLKDYLHSIRIAEIWNKIVH